MMNRKWVSLATAFLVLFHCFVQLPAAGRAYAAASDKFAGAIAVTLMTDNRPAETVDAVLGREHELAITVANTDGMLWAYNVGFGLRLPDGLEVSPAAAPQPSATTVDSNGDATVYWRDVKDLAPGEVYTFPVKLRAMAQFRGPAQSGDVPFGYELDARVAIYASNDARKLYEAPDAANVTADVPYRIVPFAVRIDDAGEHVKGAGPDAQPPADGDEYGAFGRTIVIENNTRSSSVFTTFRHEADGALETYGFGADGTPPPADSSFDPATGKRNASWTGLAVAAGADRDLSFKAAFLNRHPDGSLVRDNTTVTNRVVYAGSSAGYSQAGSTSYTATARDAVIEKSVSPEHAGYDAPLTYTVTLVTNEYYGLSNVKVTDTIGDGQTFDSYAGPAGNPASPVRNGEGKTVIEWSEPSVGAGMTRSFGYVTTVDGQWDTAYGGGPVVAGDVIVNDVELSGESQGGFEANGDRDHTDVAVKTPSVSERIVAVNGDTGLHLSEADVKVGDTVTFQVTYDAAGIGAKQHDVIVYDYLPLGTLPDANGDGVVDPADLGVFQLNGVTPEYDASNLLLVWDLGDLPESTTTLTANVMVVVQDSTAHVGADKGAENLVNLSYANSASRVESKRASAKLAYVEPKLTIERSIGSTPVRTDADPPVQVAGGQSIAVHVKIANTGQSTAYGTAFEEPLPSELTNVTPVTPGCTVSGSMLACPALGSILPGGSVTVTYTADVANPIGASRTISQQSEATYTARPEPAAIQRSYTTGEPAHVTMRTPAVAITKVRWDTALGSAAGDFVNVRVGDWIVYKIDVAVPANVEAYDGALTDTIPANQSFVDVMHGDYDAASNTGTSLGTGSYATHAGPPATVRIPFGPVTAAGTYTYFVRTRVDKVASGHQETQQSRARFDWKDRPAGGTERGVQSASALVTVKLPNLTSVVKPTGAAGDTPANVTMGKDDIEAMTYKVTNTGLNTAFDFIPSVTLPPGFRFTDASGVTDATDVTGDIATGLTKTYARTDLAAGGTLSRDFHIRLESLEGAGTTHAVRGKTNIYYATHEAYVNDSDGDAGNNPTAFEKFAGHTATGTVVTPSVTLANTVADTSNGDSVSVIRAGDTVDYELKLTVPAGTTAYGVTVTDDVYAMESFDVVDYEMTPASLPEPQPGDWSGGTLTYAIGDVDASAGAKEFKLRLQLRAKKDAGKPAPGTYGTSAKAAWQIDEAGMQPARSTPVQTTSVEVIEPNVTIAADPVVNPQFTDDHPQIEVGFTVANEGAGTAYETVIELPIPAGLRVVDGTVSEGGSFNAGTRTVVWSGLAVAGGGTRTVKAAVTPAMPGGFGAGTANIVLEAKLVQYQSTPDEAGLEPHLFRPGATAGQTLSVAPAMLDNVLEDSTNGGSTTEIRPGDRVTFRLALDLPGGSPAYGAVLKNAGLTQLAIESVSLNGGNAITPDDDGDYPLGDIAADAEIVVTARARTDINLPQDVPYQADFTPTVEYRSTDGGAAPFLAAGPQKSIAVKQPLLTVRLNADKAFVREPGETVTVSMSVYNRQGTAAAYGGTVYIPLPQGVLLEGEPASSDNGDVVTRDGASMIRWTLAPLPAAPDSERTLVFRVKTGPDTEAGTYLPFTAALVSYGSLPDASGKTYGPVEANNTGIEVGGGHALAPSGSGSVTAGQSRRFDHTLANTGAGLDRFRLRADGPFPLDLYIDGIKAASGSPVNGDWVWSEIAETFADGNDVILPLKGGASSAIAVDIHVPETTPYGSGVHVTEFTAAATVTGSVYGVQDTLTVTGIPLEGWSGPGEAESWVVPVYGHTDGVKFQAVTAVNAASVKAFHTPAADGPVTATLLTLANAATYLKDGYKRWVGVHPLPDQVAAGEIAVTFVAFAADGSVLETDARDGARGNNNPYKLQSVLNIAGTVLDALTGASVPHASVTLYDPFNGDIVSTTTADANGRYVFENVRVNDYRIRAEAAGYEGNAIDIYALAPNGQADTLTADIRLSSYRITLEAVPSTLLGDGVSTTRLVAVIADSSGAPVEGVTVVFDSPQNRGSFPDGTTAVTDAAGRAEIRFRSEMIAGIETVRFPVTAVVNDTARKLAARDEIVVVFDPGAVEGTVTEIADGVPVPVMAAEVVVTNDFDGDGSIDFLGRTVTDADGHYRISIPRGNTLYRVTVTKNVTIGGVSQQVSFPQTVQAGAISVRGFEVFPASYAMGGILLGGDEQRGSAKLHPAVYGRMVGYLLDGNGDPVKGGDGARLAFAFGADGTFSIPSAPSGTYSLVAAYVFEDGREIIVNRKPDGTYPPLVVTRNGEMNLTSELIDPYGLVTDSVTGLPIAGAHVELLYADTQRNIDAGRKPDTLVVLPILPGFAPNDNASPQDTDPAGFYAFMVYPFTDYYLRVTKPGYDRYISPTLSVETAIVEHNLEMDPVRQGGGGTGGGGIPAVTPVEPGTSTEVDLAVELYTDRPIYPENGTVVYKLRYKNRSGFAAAEAYIDFRIPDGMSIRDAGGGTETDGVLRFELGNLEAAAAGELAFTLAAPAALAQAEEQIGNLAVIGSASTLIRPEDDRSTVKILVFSNRFGEQKHVRYTKGYPDGSWLPNRSITRAEIAAIFARILELENAVEGVSFYKDVPADLWAAGYIEAVTRNGLFGGYADGSFQPNRPITRAELGTVIYRYLQLQQGPVIAGSFSDTAGHWAEASIHAIYRHHIVTGYGDGSFRPNGLLIRTEAVAMINRLLHRGPLLGAKQSFPDMPPTHWAFGHVEESAVTHLYVRNADGSEKVASVIPEPLW